MSQHETVRAAATSTYPSWTALGNEIEVRSEALTISDSPDADTDISGFENSWRRAKVKKRWHKQRATWLLITIRAAEAMYQSNEAKDPGFKLLNEAEDDGYSHDGEPEHYSYRVQLKDCRPFRAFVDSRVARIRPGFPTPSIINDLQIGTRVLFVDPIDKHSRWIAYVRRRFTDAVQIYCLGPPRGEEGAEGWNAWEHHHVCCADDSASVHACFNVSLRGAGHVASKRVSPVSLHLRVDEDYDLEKEQWRPVAAQEKVYLEPVWLAHEPLNISRHIRSSDMTRHCVIVTDSTALRRRHKELVAHVTEHSSEGEVKACLQRLPSYMQIASDAAGGVSQPMLDALYQLVAHGEDVFRGALPALDAYHRFVVPEGPDPNSSDPECFVTNLVQHYLDTHHRP